MARFTFVVWSRGHAFPLLSRALRITPFIALNNPALCPSPPISPYFVLFELAGSPKVVPRTTPNALGSPSPSLSLLPKDRSSTLRFKFPRRLPTARHDWVCTTVANWPPPPPGRFPPIAPVLPSPTLSLSKGECPFAGRDCGFVLSEKESLLASHPLWYFFLYLIFYFKQNVPRLSFSHLNLSQIF